MKISKTDLNNLIKKQNEVLDNFLLSISDNSTILSRRASEKELVFFYSTLLDDRLRTDLFSENIVGSEDSLPNYEEISVQTKEGSGFHTIIPAENKSVEGKVFEITKEELEKLDKWEDQYNRKKLGLVSGKFAWVYSLTKDNLRDFGDNKTTHLNSSELQKEEKWIKEMKEANLKSFTRRATDFGGRAIPNTEALPSETDYPYQEGHGNYNAEQILKKKLLEHNKKDEEQQLEEEDVKD